MTHANDPDRRPANARAPRREPSVLSFGGILLPEYTAAVCADPAYQPDPVEAAAVGEYLARSLEWMLWRRHRAQTEDDA